MILEKSIIFSSWVSEVLDLSSSYWRRKNYLNIGFAWKNTNQEFLGNLVMITILLTKIIFRGEKQRVSYSRIGWGHKS